MSAIAGAAIERIDFFGNFFEIPSISHPPMNEDKISSGHWACSQMMSRRQLTRLGDEDSGSDVEGSKLVNQGEPALFVGIAIRTFGGARTHSNLPSTLGGKMPSVSTRIRFKHMQLASGVIPDYVHP